MKLILAAAALCSGMQAATYYVDQTAGVDANSGLGKQDAWKTVSKVNGAALAAGDIVLFKRGETWRETLTPSASGSAGNPITFGVYGDSSLALPVITGADVITPGSWTSATGSGTVIVQDNCNRTSSPGWGTATTGGLSWTPVTTAYTANGTVCGFNDAWGYGKALIGSNTTVDVEAYAEWSGTPDTDRETGFRLRAQTGADTLYRLYYLRSTHTLTAQRIVASAATGLGSATPAIAEAAAFKMRAIVTTISGGTQVRVRVRYWTSGAEPGTWDIDATDTSPILTGAFGIELGNNDVSQTKVDNILFQTPSGTFPDTYQTALAADPGDIFLEDNVRLTRQTSVSSVDANPGSFYWASGTIYLRATDSSDPDVSGKLYRAAQRNNAIALGARDYITMQGLHATGAVQKAITGTGTNTVIKNSLVTMSRDGGIALTGASASVSYVALQYITGVSAHALDLAGANSSEYHCTYRDIRNVPRRIAGNGYTARNNLMYLPDAQVFAMVVEAAVSGNPILQNNLYYRPVILQGFHQLLSAEGDSYRSTRLNLARSTGALISRDGVKPIDFVPSEGSYNWSRFDAQVPEYAAAGIEVLYTIHADSPSWLNGNSCFSYVPGNGSASDSAFTTWRGKEVTIFTAWFNRYKDNVKYIEIGNEINEQFFWSTSTGTCQSGITSTAAQQVSWANAVAAALKAIKPSVKIVYSGVTGLGASGGTYGSGRAFLQHSIDDFALSTTNFDGVGVHPYDGDAPDSDPAFESNFTDIALVRSDLVARGLSHWEIWATEWGWFEDTWTTGQRESYAATAYGYLRDRYPYVTISAYFMDVDNGAYTTAGAWTGSPTFTEKNLAQVIGQQWSPRISWKGTDYTIHKLASSQGVESGYLWANPGLTGLVISSTSPARNAGAAISGIGQQRQDGRADIGAYEIVPGLLGTERTTLLRNRFKSVEAP